jgi:hypothetical protein
MQLHTARSKLEAYRVQLVKHLATTTARVAGLEAEVQSVRKQALFKLKTVYTWGGCPTHSPVPVRSSLAAPRGPFHLNVSLSGLVGLSGVQGCTKLQSREGAVVSGHAGLLHSCVPPSGMCVDGEGHSVGCLLCPTPVLNSLAWAGLGVGFSQGCCS